MSTTAAADVIRGERGPAAPSTPPVLRLQPDAGDAGPKAPAEPLVAVPRGAGNAPSEPRGHGAIPRDLAQGWLVALCQMIPGEVRGVAAFGADAGASFERCARWPEDSEIAPSLLSALEHTLVQDRPAIHAEVLHDGTQRARVACPVRVAGAPRGAVAVQVEPLAAHRQQVVTQILEWGSTWLELLLAQRGASAAGRLPAVLEGLGSAFEHPRFGAVAMAVVTHLADHTDFERVSLGIAGDGGVRLAALSDSPSLSGRSPFARAVERAMAEAVNADGPVVYPAGEGRAQAHAGLAAEGGALGICSVVLRRGDCAFAVLTFERVSGLRLETGAIETCRIVAAALGPMLDLECRRDAPWWRRAIRGRLGRHLAARPTGRRLAVSLLLAALALLSLTTGEYRVSSPARVEGRVVRSVVTPFDGYLAEAGARAGDVVEEGDVLATLERSGLELERAKLRGEREEVVKQHRRALALRDYSEARVLEARVATAGSRIELMDEQLRRATLRAPFDGVVVRGDLGDSLGSALERGQVLFEVAPLEDYRIVVRVDERDVRDVSQGQRGSLSLAASPEARLPIVVEKVTPVAGIEDGRNAFRVEARPEQVSPDLRPGMTGVAKLEVDRRKLIWIWTHRLVDWVRLQLWVWAP